MRPTRLPALGGGDVGADAGHEPLELRRALGGQRVAGRHQLGEQIGELLVVARRVAENHAADDAPEGAVQAVVVEGLVGQERDLLARDGHEALALPVDPARAVEDGLVEAAPVRPQLAAGDRQRVGLEGAHPAPLGRGVGGEGVGRTLEHLVDVLHLEHQQDAVGHHPDPHGTGPVAAPQPRDQAHGAAVHVEPRRDPDRPRPAPEQALHRVGHDHRLVELHALGERGARQLLGHQARGGRGLSRPCARARSRSRRPRAPARARDDVAAGHRPSCCPRPTPGPRACRPRACSRW